MSNRDQLPNWAGRSVGPPNQQPTQPPGQQPAQPPGQQPNRPNQQSRQSAQPRARQPLASRDGRQPTPAPTQDQRQPQQGPGQPPQLVPVNQQRPAQQLPQQPFANPPQKKSNKGGRTALIVLGAIALFLLFGAGGYYVGTIGRGETTTGGEAATTSAPAAPTSQAAADSASGLDEEITDSAAVDATVVDSGDDSSVIAEDDAMVDDAATGSESDDDAEVVTVPDADDSSNPNGGVAPRRATLRNGLVYLEGTMPTREIADLAVGKAAAVVGPDRVVDEYVIDPSVPFDPAEKAPIYVEEVVLFEFNSDQIAEPFKPLLDLGVSLMIQNPQGTLTVTTHTDAVGSEEINLEVATDRAESIKRYMTAKGVPESQIVLDPRGEEDASEVDDESVAAQQRRAEFLVENILE